MTPLRPLRFLFPPTRHTQNLAKPRSLMELLSGSARGRGRGVPPPRLTTPAILPHLSSLTKALPRFVRLSLALLSLLAAPLAAPADTLESIIENFKATLQRHPNGRVKTQLTADKATLKGEKTVSAENVRIFFLNDHGHIQSVLESDTVTVDVEAQRGLCPNLVSFEQHAAEPSADAPSKAPATEGFHLEGSYVEWLGDQNQIVVHSNAVITLFREGTSLVKGWNRK